MELKFILEAVLFSAQKPLSPKELKEVLNNAAKQENEEGESESVNNFGRTKEAEIVSALEELANDHQTSARSFRLICVAGSWQFVTEPEFAPWLRAFMGKKNRPPRLTPPSLETLAIIAYRQPLTRSEIEQIRGVSVDGVMQTLLERGLVEQCGKAEVIGRPGLYATTPLFLDYFGLGSLDDLPDASELRRIPVERPEELKTTDPGLATVAPDELAEVESVDEVTQEASEEFENVVEEPSAEESDSIDNVEVEQSTEEEVKQDN